MEDAAIPPARHVYRTPEPETRNASSANACSPASNVKPTRVIGCASAVAERNRETPRARRRCRIRGSPASERLNCKRTRPMCLSSRRCVHPRKKCQKYNLPNHRGVSVEQVEPSLKATEVFCSISRRQATKYLCHLKKFTPSRTHSQAPHWLLGGPPSKAGLQLSVGGFNITLSGIGGPGARVAISPGTNQFGGTMRLLGSMGAKRAHEYKNKTFVGAATSSGQVRGVVPFAVDLL